MARVYALLIENALQTGETAEAPHIKGWVQKSLGWFRTSVAEAEAVGADGIRGQALMGLGTVLAATGDTATAREALDSSVIALESLKASHHLAKARERLAAL